MNGQLKQKIATLLEMIKFKLTIFAMPFGLTGAFLAGQGKVGIVALFWIILAMVGARTSAMSFNRIVDRKFDLKNPRTADRAIPAGEVKLVEAWIMVLAFSALFFLSCYQLNRLTFLISPFVLALTLVYSLTKRFTSLCHIVLGVALGCAPMGGWVAVSGSLSGYPWVLSIGVLFWVAGFDTIYSCLDSDFDQNENLYSLSARLGQRRAFQLAGGFHVLAFLFFGLTGYVQQLNWVYFVGLLLAGGALFNQHRIVRPGDLSRIHASFFSMNGIISMTIFIATWLSLLLDRL